MAYAPVPKAAAAVVDPISRTSSSQSSRSRRSNSDSYYLTSPSIMLTPTSDALLDDSPPILSSSISSTTSTIRAPGAALHRTLSEFCELSRITRHDLDVKLPTDAEGSGDSNSAGGMQHHAIDIPSSSQEGSMSKQHQRFTSTPSLTPARPPLLHRSSSGISSSSSSSSLAFELPSQSFAERRPRVYASLKTLALFLISFLALALLLHTLLPPIDKRDRHKIKLPRSFDDLKALNQVLQVYKDRNYWRVLGCLTTVYLFLQTFSIPGSMYLSILAGAMYGVTVALPVVCFCGATGALLCYLLSASIGPAVLLSSPKWTARLDRWKEKINSQGDNLMSYMIVLRISPLPPHWVVNLMAPHLGISIPIFWTSTFLGIIGITYIHTTIGTTLHQMTSSKDFHLFSLQNVLGLGGIAIAVLVPVIVRRVWAKEIAPPSDIDEDDDQSGPTPTSVLLSPSSSTSSLPPRDRPSSDADNIATTAFSRYHDDVEEEESEIEGGAGSTRGRGDMNKVSQVLGVNVSRKKLSSLSSA